MYKNHGPLQQPEGARLQRPHRRAYSTSSRRSRTKQSSSPPTASSTCSSCSTSRPSRSCTGPISSTSSASRHWHELPDRDKSLRSAAAPGRSARHLRMLWALEPARAELGSTMLRNHPTLKHIIGRAGWYFVTFLVAVDHQLLPAAPGRRQPHRHHHGQGGLGTRQRVGQGEGRSVPEGVRPGRARRARQGDARRGGQAGQDAPRRRSSATTWA